MIYKFYLRRGFTNEQVLPLLKADRINNWSNFFFPFIAYNALKHGLTNVMPRTFKHGMSINRSFAAFSLMTGFSWWVWWNNSPFYNNL